jgi:hypothetical protein
VGCCGGARWDAGLAREENIYKYHETINAEGKSYVADKGTYVHGYSEIFEEQFPSKNQEEKLFIKFDPNKQVFKNDTVVPKEENIKIIFMFIVSE